MEHRTLLELLRAATFKEVLAEALAVAGFLHSAGLRREGRVTLLVEGRNSWVAAEFGVLYNREVLRQLLAARTQ